MAAARHLQLTAPLRGPIVFWLSFALVILGFAFDGITSYALLLFVVPIFFGSHEALHGTLCLSRTRNAASRRCNDIALVAGMAVQFMNPVLLRASHLVHHADGRHGDGYAPDVIAGKPSIWDHVRYYSYLMGVAALLQQASSMLLLIVQPNALPFTNYVPVRTRAWTYRNSQLLVIAAATLGIIVGGLSKFAFYECLVCFSWSVLQNAAHYGLRGIDANTERVCARTIVLGEPFHSLTFGATAHLAHHVIAGVPGLRLREPEVQAYIAQELQLSPLIERGISRYALAILRQFKGPLSEQDLTTEWIRTRSPSIDKGVSHANAARHLPLEA